MEPSCLGMTRGARACAARWRTAIGRASANCLTTGAKTLGDSSPPCAPGMSENNQGGSGIGVDATIDLISESTQCT